jgi:hypothetical protein
VEPRLNRKLVIGAAGLAVLGAAGGTYAATRGSGETDRRAFLNDAAKRLDVSPNELRAALQGAFFDRLNAAVAAGRITRAEADAIKRRMKEGGGLPFLGGPHPFRGGPHPFPGGPPHFFGGGPHAGPFLGGMDAAAKYLDLTRAQLRDRLESGKSLAQVARDRGKSVDGLEEAIEDAIRSRLDAAVAAKRLTKAQERRILSDLKSRVEDIVQRSARRPPWGDDPGPPPGHAPGPPWGDRPDF